MKFSDSLPKLKTLNDLCKEHKYEEIILPKIKEEAIKWVKDIRTKHHGAQIPELLGENTVAKWIINFFNITEEDLK